MKNNRLIGRTGFLTEEGEEFLLPLKNALNQVLSSSEVQNMSVQDIRTFGAAISKILGDAVSKTIQKKSQKSGHFSDWSDEKFESYLKSKYGDKWLWKKLTDEESSRAKILVENKMGQILKEKTTTQSNFPVLKLPSIFFKS